MWDCFSAIAEVVMMPAPLPEDLFTFSASPPSCSLGPAPTGKVTLFLFLKHAKLLSVSGICLLWTRALGLLNQ